MMYSQHLLDVISASGCNVHKYANETYFHKAHHLMHFILCRQAFRHVLMMSYLG